MHRVAGVLSVFAAIGILFAACGGPNTSATAAVVATTTTTAQVVNTYEQQVSAAGANLIQSSLNLADTTVAWTKAPYERRSQYLDPVLRDQDVLRAANDALVRWVGLAPSQYSNLDAENKRITDRTDTYLRQFREALYGTNTPRVLALVTSDLEDVKQYQMSLYTSGIPRKTM